MRRNTIHGDRGEKREMEEHVAVRGEYRKKSEERKNGTAGE